MFLYVCVLVISPKLCQMQCLSHPEEKMYLDHIVIFIVIFFNCSKHFLRSVFKNAAIA